MAAAVLAPLMMFVLGAFDREGEIGLFIFTQPALGLLGGIVALFYRSIPLSDRLRWAAFSISLGIVLVPLWWTFLILLLGP